MRILLLLLILTGCLLYAGDLHAQSPTIEFSKAYGTNDGEYVKDVQPTSDGGFIIAGHSAGLDNGDLSGHHGFGNAPDIWVVKTDRLGNIEWQKTFGGTSSEDGAYIIPTNDGGYMIAASVSSKNCDLTNGYSGFDYWVAKLSSTGDVSWQKKYGGSNDEIVSAFSASPDGGFVVSGSSFSNDGDVTGNHGVEDFWVIKIDASGTLLWQKSLGGSDYDHSTSVQATTDGGCVLTGFTASSNGDLTGNHQFNDYWVVKLDKTGTLQWQKPLGGSMSEFGYCVRTCKDGGYIVSGHANSSDGDVSGSRLAFDAWIIKLDKSGNIVWEKTYGGFQNETANAIRQTIDGGFVFAGSSASKDGDVSCNAGLADVLVMKIDANGNLQWQKTMGGSGYDEAFDLEVLADGSIAIAATSESPEIPGYHTPAPGAAGLGDIWLIKLSAPVVTQPLPVVTIDPASATMCKGGTTTVTATVLYGGATPTYQWLKNGSPVGTNSPYYKDPSLNSNDVVKCIVTNNDGCNPPLQGSDAVTITVVNNNIIPTISIGADNTVMCNCNTITVKAIVNNAGASPKYRWKINGIEMNYDHPTLVSNNLKVDDQVECTYSDNLTCPGTIISNTIKFTGGGPVAPSVSITATTDTVCKEGTVIFTAYPVNAGVAPTYQWKINGVVTGTNSAVLTSSSLTDGAIVNCTITADPQFKCAASPSATSNNIAIHVTGQIAPTLDLVASAESICKGSLVTFTATAKNAGTSPNYRWKINGVSTGGNTNVITSSQLADNDVVTCTMDADRRYACAVFNQVVSKSITMKVKDGVPPTVNISADKNDVCPGTAIKFIAIAKDAGASPIYEWTVNGLPLSATRNEIVVNNFQNGDNVVCNVTASEGSCSTSPVPSNAVIVSITPPPVITISPVDTFVATGTQVQLRVSVTGDIGSFKWTPADRLMNDQLLSPLTNPITENTTFRISVIGSTGCVAEATALVKISTALVMPNAFTPNNDGRNDLFIIPGTANIDLLEFAVYNRWGNAVFKTSDRNRGWDGTIGNVKAQSGTYVYFIRYKEQGVVRGMKGVVMVVR